MKTLLAVIMIATSCFAQDKTKDEPLKCGQYEHVEHWPGRCGPSLCKDLNGTLSSCDAVCTPLPPDKCVDDLHTVSEKEWQSLLVRLTILEKEVKSHNSWQTQLIFTPQK